MKNQSSFVFLIILSIVIVWGCASPSMGQTDQSAQIAVSSTNCAPSQFQILDQHRATGGNRSIIYNFVVQPVFSKRRLPDTPTSLSSQGTQAELQREQKNWQPFFFSAVIYNHQITELRWGDKYQYRAFSNIDFNHFSFLDHIETDTAVYELFFMPSNESTDFHEEAAAHLPSLQLFPQNQFSYIVDKSDPAPPANTLATLDALHAYYNANSKILADQYEKHLADQRAREQMNKSRSLIPTNTVINYWPIKSTRYSSQTNQGGAQ